ncbi:MAG TPA: response regulator [Puia sp.]|nr:response regulator [Puia sp.]
MQPKIMLVDDREDNLMSMESVLEPDGYRFVKANSGRQVLKHLLTDFDFALILMDVQMPNLNGFETAALIYERDRLRHIPIIFITANNYGEENLFRGYRAGAVDYIYKPVNPELLRVKVGVFVDLYRKNQRLIAQEQKLVAINRNLELEINERKASEEKVTELNKQLLENISRLEAVNKDLDLFAFMASHDLQAPLRKIRMFSDRLLASSENSFGREGKLYLTRIQEVSKRMQDLINDILRFSKIAVEKQSFEEVDLNGVIEEVLSEMEPVIREKNAQVELDKLPMLPASTVLMGPLFSNLISNALKYSKKDENPRVRIRYEEGPVQSTGNGKDAEIRFGRIYIEDNGIGFDQKYAEQIFDMFRRLHSNAEYEGTGIGLALCKKIVEMHHGYISALGKPGEGSVFIVSLPLSVPQKELIGKNDEISGQTTNN